MGASYDSWLIKGVSTHQELRDKFAQIQEDDRYENGHSYSGTIGMACGLEITDKIFEDNFKADEWLSNNTEKYEPAKAVKLTDGSWLVGAWCSS
jgi:hypothetical protein